LETRWLSKTLTTAMMAALTRAAWTQLTPRVSGS
jgi:hypothetical protein